MRKYMIFSAVLAILISFLINARIDTLEARVMELENQQLGINKGLSHLLEEE